MPSHLFQESLDEMDTALVELGALVPQPRSVPFKDSHVYRHLEKLPQQAIVQKLARLPSGLRAAHLLLDAGLFQEQAALQRLVDEIGEDVIFLAIPLIFGGDKPIHTEYLDSFFAEEFDPTTGLPTAQDRPMVSRKKIRAYIAHSPIGGEDPSGHTAVARTLSKTYSGYVHAASPQIMDMYGGNPPRFHTQGMLGKRKHIGTVFMLLILGGGIYLEWPFIVGHKHMESFCQSLVAGSTLSQVQQEVATHGYKIVVGPDGTGLVHDTRSFGRFLCQTRFENEKLVRANYLNND